MTNDTKAVRLDVTEVIQVSSKLTIDDVALQSIAPRLVWYVTGMF
jgi:hypothetical protein